MIVGGSGFVGTAFLSMYDFDAVIADKISYQNKTATVDITTDSFDDYFSRDIDAIVHLADVNTHNSHAGMYDFYSNNVSGTLNIVKNMKKYNIKHIVFLSTSQVYGNGEHFTEFSAVSPCNAYLNTKVTCENIIKDYCRETGAVYQILRASSISGCINEGYLSKSVAFPGNHLISNLILNYFKQNRTVIKNSKIVRDYIHVKDVCECINKCLLSKERGIFNIGSGISTNVQSLVDKIKKQTGEMNVVYKNESIPVMKNSVNCELFNRNFDMQVKYNLDDIIHDCLAYGRKFY